MATLYVTELSNVGFHAQADHHSPPAQIALLPPITEQTVAIGAGSVQSSVFNFRTNYIRVCADAVCSIQVGSNPTATATALRLCANVPEYFGLATVGLRIAVIQNT